MRVMNSTGGAGSFASEIAIVTGASSGIGRAASERLHADGARVVVFARSEERLREVASRDPERILVVIGDLADPEAIERLFAVTESRFGACTILVNNAGPIEPAPVAEMTLESWDLHFAVNVRAAFLTCRRALNGMRHAGHGSIVNVASISGVPGPQKFPGFAAYCAAKAALIGFTEALAVEVGGAGIRVNCVSPGSVETPMLRRVAPSLEPGMSAAEVADVIAFLASPSSRPINGQNIHAYSS